MSAKIDFARLYADFSAPIAALDCGEKCAAYNGGIPVCCDTRHSVPTAYPREWAYLKARTDLWHRWDPDDAADLERLSREAGPDLVLMECLGAAHCQREYRSLVCRAFPFFPYVDAQGDFSGVSVYWEYEDRCWVLSNLDRVTPEYMEEFVDAYTAVFELRPDELVTFQSHSAHMRAVFQETGREIPLIRRDGQTCLLDPQTETLRRVNPKNLDKYGPFAIADRLPFPDET